MNSIFQRTSIRQFQQRNVEDYKIEQMLKAAMAAPSAGNQQPWEYYVVTNKEKLKELSMCSPFSSCIKDATLAFVACYRTRCAMPEYATIDLSASVENLLLEAVDLKLGCVWLGIAPLVDRMEKVKRVLSIGDELEAFAMIPCGYPLQIKKQENRFDQDRIHRIL